MIGRSSGVLPRPGHLACHTPNSGPDLAGHDNDREATVKTTTANQAYRQAANSPAGRKAADAVNSAADTAKSIGDEVSDFAGEVPRMAGQESGRAQDAAPSRRHDEAHAAVRRNPGGARHRARRGPPVRRGPQPAARLRILYSRLLSTRSRARGRALCRGDVMFTAWMRFAADTALLCQETQEVIGLRMMKLALGGSDSHLEAQRMAGGERLRLRRGRRQSSPGRIDGPGGPPLS